MTPETIFLFFLSRWSQPPRPGRPCFMSFSAGISSGRRGYWPALLGILSADGLYFVLSAAGLGTFLLASYNLFVLIKWVGAMYLIWLGLRLVWLAITRSEGTTVESARATGPGQWLSGGFMVHAANPKALLYFASIVPQFLHPDGRLLPQIVLLGVVHLATALTVLCAYGIFASRIRAFARHPWFARSLNGTSGALLIAAGAGVASLKQRG